MSEEKKRSPAEDNKEGPWCSAKLECGGPCCLVPGHPPPCLCGGDMDGPGTCPAPRKS